jgi:hypothetical protein
VNSSLAHGLACSWTEQRQPWTWSQRKSHRAPEAEAPALPARLAEDRERGFANIGRRQLGQRVELGHTEGGPRARGSMHPRIPSLLQRALLHSPNKHVEPILPEEWLTLVYHGGNSPVSCRPQGAIILSKSCLISLWISNDCAFEFREVEPCTCSRLG